MKDYLGTKLSHRGFELCVIPNIAANIVNNGGYRIIKQRLLAFHGDDHYVGMDFVDPKVDFTAMAKALGMEAFRISEASELKTKLSSAFSAPGPKLIEVMVDGSL